MQPTHCGMFVRLKYDIPTYIDLSLIRRYVHNDTKPSFSDFKPFGGWTKPHLKQYFQIDQIYRGVSFDYSP